MTKFDFDYTIEDADLEDLAAIVDIYNETISSRSVTADLEPVTVNDRLKWYAEHSPTTRPLWVLRSEGRVIAWLSLQSFYGRPAYAATAEVSIYISEAWRGRGLGSILLNRLFEACPRIGVKTLLGFVFGHNAPSLGLLAKHGFDRWGNLPQVANLDGVERDLIILGKRVEV